MIRKNNIILIFFLCCFSHLSLSQTFSKKYTGFVGTYPVVFTLYASEGQLSGTYYYDNSNEPISIRGLITGRSIEMRGYDLKGNPIERFIGQINKYDIHGIWIGEGSRERQSFSLKEAAVLPNPDRSREWVPYGIGLAILAAVALLFYLLRNAMRSMTRITGKYAGQFIKLFRIRNSDDAYEFEKFMTEKLGADRYKLIEWHNEILSENAEAKPDLEFERKNSTHEHSVFSIECEYKNRPSGNRIELKKKKLSYSLQAKALGKPVFFAIGLGGKPSHPDTLYIVPADKVKDHILDIREIEEFRISGGKLTYTPEDGTLK